MMERCPSPGGYRDDRLTTTELAMRIALAFANRLPTARQIANAFPMSKPTAYRYLRALKDAKGME